MTVATLENPTAVKPYAINDFQDGDFDYIFTDSGHKYLVWALTRDEAQAVFEDFIWSVVN